MSKEKDKNTFPDKIKMMEMEYDVIIEDDEEFCKKMRGELDAEFLVLRLNATLPEAVQKKTMVHEMVHAYADSLYMDLNEDEDLIEKIGNICYFMIKELQRIGFKL